MKRLKKREHPRIARPVEVKWKSGKRKFSGYSRNITEKGIFIETGSPLKEGTETEFELLLPDNSRIIGVIGKVVWVRRGRQRVKKGGGEISVPGMGIEFRVIDKKDKDEIDKYFETVEYYGWHY